MLPGLELANIFISNRNSKAISSFFDELLYIIFLKVLLKMCMYIEKIVRDPKTFVCNRGGGGGGLYIDVNYFWSDFICNSQAMAGWGELMQAYHGKDSTYRDRDPTVKYLGYYTDKGMCYMCLGYYTDRGMCYMCLGYYTDRGMCYMCLGYYYR